MNDYEQRLLNLAAAVTPPDKRVAAEAQERQQRLAKPPGSLGRLEELSVQLAGITGKVENRIKRKTLIVFAADNGVVAEGVASAPKEVTRIQAINLTRAKAGAAVIANHFGCDIMVCDVGVDGDCGKAVLDRKIRRGTENIAHGPAMSREQAAAAVIFGLELAADVIRGGGSDVCVKETEGANRRKSSIGADIIGVGEIGIGNTTTSAAVLTALTGRSARELTGRGGGVTDAVYRRKIAVVKSAVTLNSPNPQDPLDVLSKVGGLDIAAMTGAFIGAALSRAPAVVDGVISATAALCAVRLCPLVREYIILSHESLEPGYNIAAAELGLRPLFALGMRLGEGSGCPIAFEIVSAACAVLNDMVTFDETGIDDGYLDEVRAEDNWDTENG